MFILLYVQPSIEVTGQKAAVLIKIWTLGTTELLLHIVTVWLAIASYPDPQMEQELRYSIQYFLRVLQMPKHFQQFQKTNRQIAGPAQLLRNRSSSVPALTSPWTIPFAVSCVKWATFLLVKQKRWGGEGKSCTPSVTRHRRSEH